MRFGEGSLRLPSALGEPPDSDLVQVEWWAIPRDGTPFVLHDVTDFDISDIAGSRGSITISVPVNTVTHDALYAATVTADADLEVECRLFGGANQALRGFLDEADGDDIAESGTRKWSGCLVAGLVYESPLYPNATDPKFEWHFAGKNAGQIVATLVAEAKARGELSTITTSTFSPAADSLGNPWGALTTTITLSPGSTIGELLEEFEELGMCEWDVSPNKELRLFIPGARGTDRTVGQGGVAGAGFGTQPFGTSPFGGTPSVAGGDLVVLHKGRDLFDAGRKWSVRNSLTGILTAGKEGLYQVASDPSAEARRGRKVVGYESAGQVDNLSALQAFAQNTLATRTPGATELSHGLVVNGPGPRPFVDVTVGDWVWSDTGVPSGPERLRVQQVLLSRSGDDLQSAAVVGTLSQSAIVALRRQLARMQRGTTVVGTSVDPTNPAAGEDVIPPSAPTGLVASSIAYQDVANGETLARIDLAWDAVTTDARGAISPSAQAAQIILDRFDSGAPVLEDWTWAGAPPEVGEHNDALLAAHAVVNPDYDFPDDIPQIKTWLADYIFAAEQDVSDPVVTDDVAGYRVRYAYVGLNQIGGIPSSDPFEGDVLAYYSATNDTGTTATAYSWGGVGAGRDVRLQVAAFDRSGNQSVWSTPLVITTAIDNLPPATTSTPSVESKFASVLVTWNGLTIDGIDMRVAATDFSHVEVHLSPVLDFEPGDLTFQANLATAGTWPVNDLEYGVGYFARLVAVDTAGNKASPSTSAGPAVPGKLVNIDIGPDAIERVQIKDGEIVNAKIADLAVNDAKIASLNVGKLVTGTLFAAVTLSGIIRTALTGARTEIDAAGVRLYNQVGNQTVNLNALDGSVLVTGRVRTGISGERAEMDPDGSLRFYPVAGVNYSSINNFGNDVVWRGPLDAAGRSGRFNVNVLGAALNFSSEAEIPSNLRAEFAVFDRRTRLTSPFGQFVVNGKLATPDGSQRRMQFSQTNASGAEIATSRVQYCMSSTNSGGFSGNDAGIKFEVGQVLICGDFQLNSFGVIKAAEFATPSSLEIKTDVADLGMSLDRRAVDVARLARPITFRYKPGVTNDNARHHVGLAVEEIAALVPELVNGWDRPAKDRSLSAMGVATVALGAAADNADDIDQLRARLERLEAQAAK